MILILNYWLLQNTFIFSKFEKVWKIKFLRKLKYFKLIGQNLKLTMAHWKTLEFVSANNQMYSSVLFRVVKRGDSKSLTKYVNEGAMLDLGYAFETPPKWFHEEMCYQEITGFYDCSLIDVAICHGHLDIVKIIIESGVDVNDFISNPSYLTAVATACIIGETDIVKYLVSQGADIEIFDRYERTPLYYASKYGHIDLISFLLSKGAQSEVNDDRKMSPLMIACKNGKVDSVDALLNHGVSVEGVDYYGNSVLINAVYGKCIDIFDRLIIYGVNINHQNKNRETALIIAVKEGHFKIVERLISLNCDIDLRDKYGKTAFMWATDLKYYEIADMIMESWDS